MSDLLRNAVNKAKAANPSIPGNISGNIDGAVSNINNTLSAGSERLSSAQDKLNDLKNFRPEISPSLLLQEQKAKILRKKAKATELLLMTREEAVEEAKERLSNIVSIPKIPSIKLPPLDFKMLQRMLLVRLMNELQEQRKKLSKENLKKGVETYSYPMKKIYDDYVK